MKNMIFLLLSIFICSCQSGSSESMGGKYTISGTSLNSEYDGKSVYLTRDVFISGGEMTIDSTLIQAGKFSFSGSVEKPEVYTIMLKLPEKNRQMWNSVQLEAGNITVSIKDETITVGGTPVNNTYQASRDSIVHLFEQYRSSLQNLTGTQEEVNDKTQSMYQKFIDLSTAVNVDYVKTNLNGLLGRKVLFDTYRQWPVSDLEKVLNQIPDSVKEKPAMKSVTETYGYMKNTQPGNKFTDLKLTTPEGKEVSLSEYVGKSNYTLIDLWSPGCGGCTIELPTLTEAYKLYKDKGLEIVGISLDCDKERLANVTKEHKLSWTQLISGGCSPGGIDPSMVYAMAHMPLTVLLDKDGTIVARDMKGKALLNKLAETIK